MKNHPLYTVQKQMADKTWMMEQFLISGIDFPSTQNWKCKRVLTITVEWVCWIVCRLNSVYYCAFEIVNALYRLFKIPSL